MHVIVSGGTGFLGRHLCRRLHFEGHNVTALGRDLQIGADLEKEGIEFRPIDLVQPLSDDGFRTLCADAFVHAAALSSAWGRSADFMAANVDGTRNALNLARRAGVRRFVFVSTPSLYFCFADQERIAETASLPRPVNAYAASKRAAEQLVLAADELGPVVLRPRAIYGPGDGALLPRLVRAAQAGPLPLLRGGRAVTNLTYVDDVVSAIVMSLGDDPALSGQVVNIANPEVLPVRSIIEQAAKRAKVSIRWRSVPWPIAYGGVRMLEGLARLHPRCPEPPLTTYGLGILAFSQTLDTTKAVRLLGFVPRVPFGEGLERTFDRQAES
jgi:nucleoside-diphosphate-sugar epimerase